MTGWVSVILCLRKFRKVAWEDDSWKNPIQAKKMGIAGDSFQLHLLFLDQESQHCPIQIWIERTPSAILSTQPISRIRLWTRRHRRTSGGTLVSAFLPAVSRPSHLYVHYGAKRRQSVFRTIANETTRISFGPGSTKFWNEYSVFSLDQSSQFDAGCGVGRDESISARFRFHVISYLLP